MTLALTVAAQHDGLKQNPDGVRLRCHALLPAMVCLLLTGPEVFRERIDIPRV